MNDTSLDPSTPDSAPPEVQAALQVYRRRLFKAIRVLEHRRAATQALVDLTDQILDEVSQAAGADLSDPANSAGRNAFYVHTMARRIRAAATLAPTSPDGQSIEMTAEEMERLQASSPIR